MKLVCHSLTSPWSVREGNISTTSSSLFIILFSKKKSQGDLGDKNV